jgi:hypothetical protein
VNPNSFPRGEKRGPAVALCEFCNCFQAPSQHDGTDPGPNVDRSVLALKMVLYWANEKPHRLNREVNELVILPLNGESTCLMLFSMPRHTNLVSSVYAAHGGREPRVPTRGDRSRRDFGGFQYRAFWSRHYVFLLFVSAHLAFSGEPLVGAG